MRVPCGCAQRVGVGDEVIIHARLQLGVDLARLFVFAKEDGEDGFSPYIPNIRHGVRVETERPQMMSMLTMRLTDKTPARMMSFSCEINGYIRVMQEIDTAKDPLARVKLERILCKKINLRQKLMRKIHGLMALNQ